MAGQSISLNAAIMAETHSDLGIEEWPGAKHNPAILQFWADAGMEYGRDDETPWCAAYVGSVLGRLGIPGTFQPNARSYMGWGEHVPLDLAVPGDVVVFWRGSRQGWQGHVAFFVKRTGNAITVRGGNQGDKVSERDYSIDRVLAVRRWMGGDPTETDDRPTLRQGNRAVDPFVTVLQEMLSARGFFHGTADGLFGPRTNAAVVAFQASAGLVADGIVGTRTWEALARSDVKLPERDVTADDLQDRGSRTVKLARRGQRATEVAGVSTAGWVWANFDTLSSRLGEANGIAASATSLVVDNWPLVLFAVGAVGVYFAFRRVEAIRVGDARSGANVRL